ncbi:MAG: hypothetical protein M3253_00475, partial [Chloroflexota bacterium]|nr:hypothetical protein [Chloroflexota bacterium]
DAELGDLGDAVRGAVDIPAKIRRNPVKTVGLASGAAFLVLGGPKRVLKRAEKRRFPRRKVRRLVPEEIEDAVRHLPEEEQEQVMAHIERDFKTYLERAHVREQPSARRSFWGTYDTIVAILGAAAARELVKRLFEPPAPGRKIPSPPPDEEAYGP